MNKVLAFAFGLSLLAGPALTHAEEAEVKKGSFENLQVDMDLRFDMEFEEGDDYKDDLRLKNFDLKLAIVQAKREGNHILVTEVLDELPENNRK